MIGWKSFLALSDFDLAFLFVWTTSTTSLDKRNQIMDGLLAILIMTVVAATLLGWSWSAHE